MAAVLSPDDRDAIAGLAALPRSERVERLFGFSPTDYQADLLDYQEGVAKAQAAPKAGRQVGKTVTAGVIGADHALMNAGTDVLYAAPSQATADEMFRECKQHFKDAPFTLEQFGIVKANERTWEFEDGRRILARTLGNVDRKDNPGTRGMNPSCVIVDEAAYEKDAVYTEVVEEFFITHPAYEYYLFSTPAGQSGYFYDAVDGENEAEWYSPHWPTEISPFAQADYIEKKREQFDRDTFAQEFLGEFIAAGNSYIEPDLYRRCQRAIDTSAHPNDETDYYGGVDIAGSGKDRTVYVVMTGGGDVVHVENEETSTQPGILGRLAELHEAYDFVAVGVDANAIGTGVADYSAVDAELSPVVNGISFTTPTKSKMYKRLKAAFENAAITVPDHKRLEHETTRLNYEYTASRHVRVSHPENGHDDHPDALALANFMRESNSHTPDEDRGLRGF